MSEPKETAYMVSVQETTTRVFVVLATDEDEAVGMVAEDPSDDTGLATEVKEESHYDVWEADEMDRETYPDLFEFED